MATIAKNWVFTLNNYTTQEEDRLSKLYEDGYIKYIIYGYEEAPTTGTKHLQGYIQLTKKTTLSNLKKKTEIKTIHIESAKGTLQQNKEYTTKSNNYIEKGIPTTKGQRSEMKTYYEQIIECDNWNEVLKINETKKYLKYAKEVFKTKETIKPQEGITLRPFQQQIIDIINQPADDRSIYWVYDDEGGIGKTFISKYLVSNYKAFYFRPAKGADILYTYNNQEIVILDIPRCIDEQYINWGILEQLKDGIIFSGKYEGKQLYRSNNAHVIVMSNHLPPQGVFSNDRIKILNYNDKQQEIKIKKVKPNRDIIIEVEE